MVKTLEVEVLSPEAIALKASVLDRLHQSEGRLTDDVVRDMARLPPHVAPSITADVDERYGISRFPMANVQQASRLLDLVGERLKTYREQRRPSQPAPIYR